MAKPDYPWIDRDTLTMLRSEGLQLCMNLLEKYFNELGVDEK